MKFQQKQQPGPEHRGGCQRANTHTKLMAFRLLSGEAVGCEAEIGKLGKKDWSKKSIWKQSYVGKMSNLKDCTNCTSLLFVACEVLTSYHVRAWDEDRSLTCHIGLLKHNRHTYWCMPSVFSKVCDCISSWGIMAHKLLLAWHARCWQNTCAWNWNEYVLCR